MRLMPNEFQSFGPSILMEFALMLVRWSVKYKLYWHYVSDYATTTVYIYCATTPSLADVLSKRICRQRRSNTRYQSTMTTIIDFGALDRTNRLVSWSTQKRGDFLLPRLLLLWRHAFVNIDILFMFVNRQQRLFIILIKFHK